MTVCVQVRTQGGPFTDDVGDSGNVSIPLLAYVLVTSSKSSQNNNGERKCFVRKLEENLLYHPRNSSYAMFALKQSDTI